MVSAERYRLRFRMQSTDCSIVAGAVHDLTARDGQLSQEELARARDCLVELHGLARSGLAHDYLRLLDYEVAPAEAARLLRLSRDLDVRTEAFYALIGIGEAALPELVALSRHPDAEIRSRAYLAIRRIDGPQTTWLLVDGLTDDEASVRWIASNGLVARGDRAFVPVLQTIARRRPSLPFHRAAARVVRRCWPEGADDEAQHLARALERQSSIYEAPALAFDLLTQLRRGGPTPYAA